MVFAQSIGPLDFFGRLIVRQFCRGLNRATVRDARSQKAARFVADRTPVEQTADPVFLYDVPAEQTDLSGDGLGPESGPYAVISVRTVPGFRDGSALVARAVDRLAHSHEIRSAFLPLGRCVGRRSLDRRHPSVLVEPGAVAGVYASRKPPRFCAARTSSSACGFTR